MTIALVLLFLLISALLLGRWAQHDGLATHGQVAWFD